MRIWGLRSNSSDNHINNGAKTLKNILKIKWGIPFIADILICFPKKFNTLKNYKSIRVMIAFKYGIDKVKLGENRNNIKYIYRKSSISSVFET